MNENRLREFREEVQAMCFYWKSTHKHGHCQEANGMDHVCCFCELVEKLDDILVDFV